MNFYKSIDRTDFFAYSVSRDLPLFFAIIGNAGNGESTFRVTGIEHLLLQKGAREGLQMEDADSCGRKAA